jgi:hypothetical protein
VDVVPRVLIKGGGGADGDNSTGSVIEGLMAMLLSETMSKPVVTEAPKPDAKKK